MSTTVKPSPNFLLWLTALLGAAAFATLLAFHNIADGDVWAKLALGASVWDHGDVMRTDLFAFTPTLPTYIDHEWGAGLVFFSLLKWFGPSSLMVLKIGLAFGTLGAALYLARRAGAAWPTLLLLAIPCGYCILPGFAPVVRSHAFTYFFFAVTLWGLEMILENRRGPIILLAGVTLLWANTHGGFVVGLGMMGIYSIIAWLRRGPWPWLLLTTLVCFGVSFVNPYGAEYWHYLVPALLHKRPYIMEWRPMPVWSLDAFTGFRVLFVIAVIAVLAGWRRLRDPRSWAGCAVLFVTAFVTWRSRRHAPFFGVACAAFLGQFIMAAGGNLRARLADSKWPAMAALAAHGIVAVFVAVKFLPGASLQPLAPVGAFPVREVDVLANAKLTGNLAVPFSWGSYATWRLYPRVKVSVDGRYEEIFPESTFLMNHAFHYHEGQDWDRLVREFPVDFVILDLRDGKLRPADLQPYGYTQVWQSGQATALLVSAKHLAAAQRAVAELPPTTIEPLDANIPKNWWQH
jgi:hypothetical protein